MKEKSCRLCAYHHAEKEECRFNPPTVMAGHTLKTYWPKVKPDDWCGQFMSAENLYHKKGK